VPFSRGSAVWYDSDNPNHEATKVIDNQDQTERLLRKLTEVLPLSALATPPQANRGIAAVGACDPSSNCQFRRTIFRPEINLYCKVTKVFYLGDEGGITCQVTFDEERKRGGVPRVDHSPRL
jgi:hypothetical protein